MKIFVFIAVYLTACINADKPTLLSAAETNADNLSETSRIKTFAAQAKKFCTVHGYNNKIFFIADMHLHSGKKRFFVYDIKADSIQFTSVVAHGAGGYNYVADVKFSNEEGSGLSSAGKYKIGYKYNGRFGKAYKLYGLDSTNSNAFARCVVLHSYYEVPDEETYPKPIYNSLGCVMVSVNFFKQLENKIDASSKPVLLWIVD